MGYSWPGMTLQYLQSYALEMHRGESLLCVLYSLGITPHFIILLAVWYEDGMIRFSCFFEKYDIIITIKVIIHMALSLL